MNIWVLNIPLLKKFLCTGFYGRLNSYLIIKVLMVVYTTIVCFFA